MPHIRSISFCWILWNLFNTARHRLPHYPPPSGEAGGWRRRMKAEASDINSFNVEAFGVKSLVLGYSFPLWRSNGGGFCNNFSRSSSTSRGIRRNWRRLAWGSSSSSRGIRRDRRRLASGSASAWNFYWSLIICCESWFEALDWNHFYSLTHFELEGFRGAG